jgi:small subunit ribosomal protein S20
MAIKANAKRAIRVSERKRLFNVRRLGTMRDSVKEIKKLVLAGDTKGAEKALSTAYQAIDKAAKRGVIKDNSAARKKSRLYAFITKAAKAPKVVAKKKAATAA